MLTGRLPYQVTDFMGIAWKHHHEPIPVLPKELARFQPILEKLLAKNAAERFDAEQFIQALDQLNEKSPPSPVQPETKPPPRPVKAAKVAVNKPAPPKKGLAIIGLSLVMAVGIYVIKQMFDEPPSVKPPPTPQSIPVPPQPVPTPTPIVPLQPGQVFTDKLADGNRGPEMVIIPAGQFVMGSPPGESGRYDSEKQHPVKIEKAFALGKNEVTVAEFKRFAGVTKYQTEAERSGDCRGWNDTTWEQNARYSWRNVGFEQGDNHPVVCVSWNDAVAYTNWLSQQTGKKYRLPTEAEWEYATRAGTTTARYWGESADAGCPYANAADLTLKGKYPNLSWDAVNCKDGYVFTAPVGSLQENGFGLHDMLGNVWEWTCSKYGRTYDGQEQRCVSGDSDGARPVYRGGGWSTLPRFMRAASRDWPAPAGRINDLGFRLAREL
jgi:formylglycine-generating enzyme required for sulfatase activity